MKIEIGESRSLSKKEVNTMKRIDNFTADIVAFAVLVIGLVGAIAVA